MNVSELKGLICIDVPCLWYISTGYWNETEELHFLVLFIEIFKGFSHRVKF